MRPNRRNYYRILHVQPDAPTPVITASYRAMMSKMRRHPDLGGDTAEAQLLNEAHDALKDPVRRRRYDLTRQPVRRTTRPDTDDRTRASHRQTAASSRAHDDPALCAFCRAPASSPLKAKYGCQRCGSPLTRAMAASPGCHAIGGSDRRAIPRMSRVDEVTLISGWQHPARSAQLLDLSIAGLRLRTHARADRNGTIRVIGPSFDIVARVVACRGTAPPFELHAELLRAAFLRTVGSLVSIKT